MNKMEAINDREDPLKSDLRHATGHPFSISDPLRKSSDSSDLEKRLPSRQ